MKSSQAALVFALIATAILIIASQPVTAPLTDTCSGCGGSCHDTDSDGGNYPLTEGRTLRKDCTCETCVTLSNNPDSCSSNTLTEYFLASPGSQSYDCNADSVGDSNAGTRYCTLDSARKETRYGCSVISNNESSCNDSAQSDEIRWTDCGNSNEQACTQPNTNCDRACNATTYETDADASQKLCSTCQGRTWISSGDSNWSSTWTGNSLCCGDDSGETARSMQLHSGLNSLATCTASSFQACCSNGSCRTPTGTCAASGATYADVNTATGTYSGTCSAASASGTDYCVNGTWFDTRDFFAPSVTSADLNTFSCTHVTDKVYPVTAVVKNLGDRDGNIDANFYHGANLVGATLFYSKRFENKLRGVDEDSNQLLIQADFNTTGLTPGDTNIWILAFTTGDNSDAITSDNNAQTQVTIHAQNESSYQPQTIQACTAPTTPLSERKDRATDSNAADNSGYADYNATKTITNDKLVQLRTVRRAPDGNANPGELIDVNVKVLANALCGTLDAYMVRYRLVVKTNNMDSNTVLFANGRLQVLGTNFGGSCAFGQEIEKENPSYYAFLSEQQLDRKNTPLNS